LGQKENFVMKIGIDSVVIEKLARTDENSEYYLGQLVCEGHDVKIVIQGEGCENLDLYITNESSEDPILLAGAVKNFLLFPGEVGTWWEVYNHVRYEL